MSLHNHNQKESWHNTVLKKRVAELSSKCRDIKADHIDKKEKKELKISLETPKINVYGKERKPDFYSETCRIVGEIDYIVDKDQILDLLKYGIEKQLKVEYTRKLNGQERTICIDFPEKRIILGKCPI